MRKFFLLILIASLIAASLSILDRLVYRDAVEFLFPLKLKQIKIRNDRYGDGRFAAKRRHGRTHQGIDILAPLGTPVMAAKGGWAIAGFDKNGYGRYVRLYHYGGLMTMYAHLNDTSIDWLKRVRQGDIIGHVGKTGNADYAGMKPHLHFEIREGNIPVNPLRQFKEF